MPVVSMRALLETGVHFGHRVNRWHPKMKPYIFTERNGIHILDLQQTIVAIDNAAAFIRDTVARGGSVLFVGTKRQAQEPIMSQAQRAGQPYIVERFLGGTLTNWRTIRSRIDKLLELEAMKERGELERFTKKEALLIERQIERLNRRFGGIKHMRRLPDALFVVDVGREANAVKEANRLDIPVIAMVDSNCDPSGVDIVIPANDDAIRAIRLIVEAMANAALEGLAMRKGAEEPVAQPAETPAPTALPVEDIDFATEAFSRVFIPDEEEER
ncbi:MAG: 30S ribosomal protein S2 [Thermoflexales bacterium]|nr:30S ribosomal protein S2 [Thermoflexales bacterium]MCS7324850.1 30S ribosomal protein S2 [Thermoflexales bacterium]MCX7938268.1 30S ribosomal protein S2 [Thermoflexales bacterium]MDW8054944.1 30S ribosomal protein S2 [Anaerolineae bacterium]MDW8293487.1 30S ribosomal protein S2 [Anaerolineae bacterium]